MPVAELGEETPTEKHPPLSYPNSFVGLLTQITLLLRERNHLTNESFHMGIFFPSNRGRRCNQILPRARSPSFERKNARNQRSLNELFVPFLGRYVQCPYLCRDRAKFLLSTCSKSSDVFQKVVQLYHDFAVFPKGRACFA